MVNVQLPLTTTRLLVAPGQHHVTMRQFIPLVLIHVQITTLRTANGSAGLGTNTLVLAFTGSIVLSSNTLAIQMNRGVKRSVGVFAIPCTARQLS